MAARDPGIGEGGDHPVAEHILAHRADHVHTRPHTGGGHRLVGALAAGVHQEAAPGEGLPRLGHAVGLDGEVHVQATEDDDVGHARPFPPKDTKQLLCTTLSARTGNGPGAGAGAPLPPGKVHHAPGRPNPSASGRSRASRGMVRRSRGMLWRSRGTLWCSQGRARCSRGMVRRSRGRARCSRGRARRSRGRTQVRE